MRFHDRIMIVDLAAALPQITNQFFTAIELRTRRLIAIKIAHQANAERDVFQIIAVDVAAIDLAPPTVADFDLAVAGRSPVSDYEMIREPVLHMANVAMVIIESSGIPLPRAAIVHDDKLPARIASIGRGVINSCPN